MNTPLLDRISRQRGGVPPVVPGGNPKADPPAPPRSVPEWVRRAQDKQLRAKELVA